jgi:Tfp pilus assembly protein PilX
MRRPHQLESSPRRQHGITLITTAVILVLVMLLGVSAVMFSRSEFRLAGNLQFRNTALNDAESAVVFAEQWLSSGNNYLNAGFTAYDAAGTPHLYPINYMAGLAAPDNNPLTMDWGNDNSIAVGNSRYLIERVALNKKLIPTSQNIGANKATGCAQVNIYRIVVRGESSRGTTRFIQSIYSVLSCP